MKRRLSKKAIRSKKMILARKVRKMSNELGKISRYLRTI